MARIQNVKNKVRQFAEKRDLTDKAISVATTSGGGLGGAASGAGLGFIIAGPIGAGVGFLFGLGAGLFGGKKIGDKLKK